MKMPVHSIQSLLKENIVIKCHFSEVEGHANIYWYYYNKAGQHEVVHVFQNGEDNETFQSPAYRGRTQLFHQKIQHGDASLQLLGIQIPDAGQYRCFVKDDSGPAYDEASLKVNAPYSNGLLQITQDDADVSATCTFSGGYPQAEINWKYRNGRPVNQTHLTNHSQTREGLMVIQSFLSLQLNADEEVCCFVGQERQNLSKTVCKSIPDKKDDTEVLTSFLYGLMIGFGILSIVFLSWIFLRKLGKDFFIHMKKKRQTSFKGSPQIHIHLFGLSGHDTYTLNDHCRKIIWTGLVSSSKKCNETLFLKENVTISADEDLKHTKVNMTDLVPKYCQRRAVKEVFVFVYSCARSMSTETAKIIEDFISCLRTNKGSHLVVALMNSSPNNNDIVDFFRSLNCNMIIQVTNTKPSNDMLEDGVKTLLCTCLKAARSEEDKMDEDKDTCTVSLMAEGLT